MRRPLGTLVAVLTAVLTTLLFLASCGDDVGSGQSPSPGAAPSVEVALVHATAGQGQLETQVTDVTERADLAAYTAQFSNGLAAQVTKATRAAGGNPMLAQVVSIGCDVPPSARLEDDVIVPAEVAAPTEECFAPVTTVAIAAVLPLQ